MITDNEDDIINIIDSDVLEQDFDNVDLYGDNYVEENTDGFGDDIEYE